MGVNRQWRLARHPEPTEDIGFEHFELVESPIPTPDAGEFVVQTLALGTSPAQRSYISKSLSMHDKIAIGDVMRGRGVGVVTESRNSNYQTGEIVISSTGWQDFSIQAPALQNPNVLSIQKVVAPIFPLTMTLGILGAAGATAYFGLFDVGCLQAGDTVVVSAAAGGIGSVAGQIARIAGCRVIGIAGGPEKCQWITEGLGYDCAIDYKSESVGERLDELCPSGVDVFFDNVGGEILDSVLGRLALNARVVICGFIATDYREDLNQGPRNYKNLVRKRARMEGFFIFDYRHRFQEAEGRLRNWYEDGLLLNCEDVDDGLEQMPGTLGSLFTGGNKGIKLCRVSPDPG
ncbi:MAG: zinc-binding dehydrogenase [Alphaproteobacteria bacterium]|nr:zinc-binding dehydrogenase [Alphaproteobacteria bacterium]